MGVTSTKSGRLEVNLSLSEKRGGKSHLGTIYFRLTNCFTSRKKAQSERRLLLKFYCFHPTEKCPPFQESSWQTIPSLCLLLSEIILLLVTRLVAAINQAWQTNETRLRPATYFFYALLLSCARVCCRLAPNNDTTIQKYLQRIQTKLQQAGAVPTAR
jgi:H+/gluconate symporter-like permease